MDVNNVCRTCLKENSEMQSIFCEDPSNSLSNMIAACSVTTVSELDGLPSNMCVQCVENVKTSYNFKQQCESAYETLKSILGIQIYNSAAECDKAAVVNSDDNLVKLPDLLSDRFSDTDFDCEFGTVEPKSNGNELIAVPQLPNEKSIQTEEVCFYPCEMCEMKFFKEDTLKAHRMLHKDSGFKCRLCSKVYSRLTHLRRHISVSHPEMAISKTLDAIVCSLCNKQFTRNEHLRRHLLIIHNSAGEQRRLLKMENDAECYKCNVCNELFPDENGFLRHGTCKKESSTNSSDNESIGADNVTKKEHLSEPEDSSIIDTLQLEMVKCEKVSDDEGAPEPLPLHDGPDNEDGTEPDFETPNIDFDDGHEISNSSSDDDNTYTPKKQQSKRRGRPRKSKQIQTKIERGEDLVASENVLTILDKIKMPKEKLTTVNQCTKCDKTFSRSTHLKRHMITHSDVKPYSCDVCQKKFSRLDHLNIHRFHHLEVKPHICDVCEKGFTRAEHLRKHKESRHGDKTTQLAKTEFCEVCQKGFTTPKYLQVHMRTHMDRVYPCKFCDDKFTTKTDLNEHLKGHVNERPFLCSECGLRFVRNDYLVIHMRRHKGEKPYKCKYCNKGFPRATDLTVHERYHTGEKTHLCTICGKGFQRAYNLLVHTRVHTGERPYQCPHCVKSFAQGNDLKAHVRRHTGERYKCDVCGDGFIQGYHLTQHKRNVHGIDMKSHIRRVEKFIPAPGLQEMQDANNFEHIQKQEGSIELSKLQMQLHSGQLPEIIHLPLENLTKCIKIEPHVSHLSNDSHIAITDTNSQSSDTTQPQPMSQSSQHHHMQEDSRSEHNMQSSASHHLMPQMMSLSFMSVQPKLKMPSDTFQ